MRIRASDVAAATGGTLRGPDVDVDGASFDTRSLVPGQLFVPLVADRDGHEFVAAAAAGGAPAALASRPVDTSITVVEVDDTAAALMALAAWARDRLTATVVGITGSVGKTSTKDLVRSAVGAGRRVAANERSFNNEQGLPVTILAAPADTEVLVLEMGMRGFGEIARLCAVGRPDIGVVTSVAPSHTERVGGIEGVARAKGELVEALPATGTAILNADDERVAAMAERTAAGVITFGHGDAADVRISGMVLDARARPRFDVHTPWGSAAVALGVSGAHMAMNAAAALAVAGVVGVDIDVAATALSEVALSSMRMQLLTARAGGLVINDAYNANPTSMIAALDALAAVDARRRIAVLGGMAELDEPDAGHRAVAARAGDLGIELIAVDTDRYGLPSVTEDEAVDTIGSIGRDTAVLVKASRAFGLERLAARLTEL